MNAPAAAPVAETATGRVRGYEDRGVKVFKGVPYAASTAGANRFRTPQPRAPWDGVLDATAYGGRCPQASFPGLMEEEAVSLPGEPMSEDCLNLNIWTPALDAGKRPVMVWFHGGMFVFGSGAGSRYDGVNLCRKQDVVVVTVNHRLNLFGYLHLGDLLGEDYAQSGNVGMLDCVAALQWVRDNIERFGGDPGNVTLFGESGGGHKASTLMAMPAAKGLFHRVICQSGVFVKATPKPAAAGFANALLEKAGLTPDRARELLDMPVDALIAALSAMGLAGVFGPAPMVDGVVLPADPFFPSAPAQSADIQMIMGTNETEITFLPGWPLEGLDEAGAKAQLAGYTGLPAETAAGLYDAYASEHPGKDPTYVAELVASDWWLGDDTIAAAERKAAQGAAPAYVYHFDKHSPARGGKLRAAHSLEIPYVFDNLHLAEVFTGPATPDNQALADLMSEVWTTFARTGKPTGPGLPPWPAYSLDKREMLAFGESVRVLSDPHPRLREALAAARGSRTA